MTGREFSDEGTNRATGSPALEESETGARRAGLAFKRHFTKPGIHPFDAVSWELRTAIITNETGEVIFEQQGVETPPSGR